MPEPDWSPNGFAMKQAFHAEAARGGADQPLGDEDIIPPRASGRD